MLNNFFFCSAKMDAEILRAIDDIDINKFANLLKNKKEYAGKFIKYTLQTKNKIMLKFILQWTGVSIIFGTSPLKQDGWSVTKVKYKVIPQIIKKHILSDPEYILWLINKFLIFTDNIYVLNILTKQSSPVYLKISNKYLELGWSEKEATLKKIKRDVRPSEICPVYCKIDLIKLIINNDNDIQLSYLLNHICKMNEMIQNYIENINAPKCYNLLVARDILIPKRNYLLPMSLIICFTAACVLGIVIEKS